MLIMVVNALKNGVDYYVSADQIAPVAADG